MTLPLRGVPSQPVKTNRPLKNEFVSVRLPADLEQHLRELAAANHRTLSGEIRMAIDKHLAANPRA